jgi:hypothetical protein
MRAQQEAQRLNSPACAAFRAGRWNDGLGGISSRSPDLFNIVVIVFTLVCIRGDNAKTSIPE